MATTLPLIIQHAPETPCRFDSDDVAVIYFVNSTPCNPDRSNANLQYQHQSSHTASHRQCFLDGVKGTWIMDFDKVIPQAKVDSSLDFPRSTHAQMYGAAQFPQSVQDYRSFSEAKSRYFNRMAESALAGSRRAKIHGRIKICRNVPDRVSRLLRLTLSEELFPITECVTADVLTRSYREILDCEYCLAKSSTSHLICWQVTTGCSKYHKSFIETSM